MTALALCAYNLAILAGTAFLVWHGWSPWWFALTALLLMSSKEKEDE